MSAPEDFLDSDDARPLRILTEYLQPLHRFRQERVHDTVVFFGSARIAPAGPLCRYYQEARELARMLTGVVEHVTWTSPLRRQLRRRQRHHGSRQPRRDGRRRTDDRT